MFVPDNLADLAFKAIAMTVQRDNSMKFTEHDAERTQQGFTMRDDDVWVLVDEVDDGSAISDVVVEVVKSDEPVTDEIKAALRERLWLRFARLGIL
jgi:predicted type IV restriction endonuclease